MKTRLPHALFGVLATLVGMAAGHLVASLLVPSSSPVLAVGSTVIDHTPVSLKEWAIRHFGSADKIILIGNVLVGVLILAAIAGLISRTRFRAGAAMLVVLVGVAGAAALTRPSVGFLDAIPSVVTAVAGVATLWWLHRAAETGVLSRRTPTEPETVTAAAAGSTKPREVVGATAARGATTATTSTTGTAPGQTRRTILVASGISIAVAAVMGGAGKLIGSFRARPEDITLPAAVDPLPPLPAGLDKTVPGITPFQVSNADFYRVDTRLDVPNLSSADWSLEIDGDVDKKVSFSFDDILGMDLVERDITLTCVSNSVGGKFVGGARWRGVLLKTLLDEAGIDNTKADQLVATDYDGMTIGSPLALVVDGRDAMLAIGMNGEALPREHGFPARIVIPGLYGFISATKWVRKLTLTTYEKQDVYWTERKWATDAPIRISSRIDTPKAFSQVSGDTFVGGVAWAQQNGGVAKVQVQFDGGPWADAMLGPTAGNDYWRQWYAPFKGEKGAHTVKARVIDGNGNMQDETRRNPFPSGSSGIPTINFTVA